MAGYLPTQAKKYLLDYLTAGTTYLGLLTGLPIDTALDMADLNGYEVTTNGYARQSITWGDASGSEPVQVVNTASVTTAPLGADMPAAPYAFLNTALTGYAGTLLYMWELTEPVAALSGKPIFIPVGKLIIE